MIITLVIVVLFVLVVGALLYVDQKERGQNRDIADAKKLRREVQELRSTLDRVELVVRENYVLEPKLSDVLLDEIMAYRRKELGK